MNKALLVLAIAATLCCEASAATKLWDINGATAGAGGATPSGNWDTATSNWTTDSTGSSVGTTWTSGDAAIFSAGTNATGTFTVTTTAPMTASSITVEEGTVQHAGTSANSLTTSGLTINSGATFSVSVASSFIPTTGSTLTLNGGTIQNRNGGVGSALLTLQANDAKMGIVLGTGGGHIQVTGASTAISIYTGLISGTGPLIIDGTSLATFRLTTTPATYSGATTITNGGRFQVSTTANTIPSGTDMTINSGGEFNIQSNQTIASLSGAGNITSSSSPTLTIASTTSTIYSGIVSGNAAITKNLASQLVLTGANTSTGALTIGSTAGNSVSIGSGGTIGSITSAVVTTANGGLIFNRSDASSYNGLVSGAGTVTKESAGILTINGNDWTNTGGVIINGGQIKFGNSAAGFATTVPVTINNGAALDMNSISDTFGSLVSSSANTTGELKLTGNLTLGQTATTGRNYFGTITGGATLTKGGGTFTQTLSGNNSTYSGNIVVSLGKIAVVHANALGDTTGTTSVSAAAEVLYDGSANSFTVGENFSIAGAGPDGGAITVQNNASEVFNGTFGLTADATVTASGTGTASFTNTITNGGFNLTLAGATAASSVSGKITGAGGLIKNSSGTWTLSNGANDYGGATTINAGTLKSGGADIIPNGSAVTLANAAANLDLNNNNETIGSLAGGGATGGNVQLGSANLTVGDSTSTTYSGVISGATGSLTKQGAGTLTLAGANTYGGGTTVSAGGLTGTTTSLQGNITNNAALTFNQNTNGTYTGLVSGSGSLTKSGTGIVELTGTNSYGGATNVNGGTLKVTGSITGSGAVTVANGGTLAGAGSLAGDVTVNSGGKLSPGASPESLDMGALTFSGTGTLDYEIDTTYNVSLAAAADLVNANGDLTIASTANLNLIELGSPTNVVQGNTKYTLISYSGSWLGGTTFAGKADDSIVSLGVNQYVINYDDITGGSNFGGGLYGDGVNPHFVTLTAIPEASSILFGGLVCIVLGVAAGGRKLLRQRVA